MTLKRYFESKKGLGVLATSDKRGRVNAAIYARPHMLGERKLAFIMSQRLTHKNLRANPHAAYLFREKGKEYNGKRLYLTLVKEENDQAKINATRRSTTPKSCAPKNGEKRFLVTFRIDKILPLSN